MADATSLLVLQSCSLTVSVLMALILVLARIYQPNASHNYETSRWLMFTSMMLFAVHYFLQMYFGIRARSEDLGVLVNIIFYTPITFMMLYASLRLASSHHHKAIYMWVIITSLALSVVFFAGGWLYYGSLHMPLAILAVQCVRFITIVALIIYSTHEIKRVSRAVENETGGDIRQFNMYMRTGTALLYSVGAIMPFMILARKTLFVMGPVFFIILCFYVLSFVALGFNLAPVSDIIDEETETRGKNETAADDNVPLLCDECCNDIAAAIDHWRQTGGYSQPDINSTTLADTLGIPKRQLVAYMTQVEGKTFRVWLSELRIEEAKRMLIEDDNYKLEAIAAACGFSHRNYLHNRFKSITGLTPSEWRDHHRK